MNIVVVGYGNMFQSLIKAVLQSEHNLVGVFRHENVVMAPLTKFYNDKYNPSNDYRFILKNKVTDIKAKSVNSKEFRKFLTDNKVDIVFVGSWSEKFSMQTINTPKIACINVHPSLLPKYRGPNPYTQVILHNEKLTGVTFHLMDVNYDTGVIIHQKEVPVIFDDNGGTLKNRCCEVARKELSFLLKHFDDKIKHQVSQNEQLATYHHQINIAESILDFRNETAEQIQRRIRAFSPWLKCCICYNNEFFTFDDYKIHLKEANKDAGYIVKKTDNAVYIVCKDYKVIEFIGLHIKRPFSKFLTKYFMEKIIKVNTQVM